MYFFTADEHYFHEKILDYCKRPFSSVKEMNEELIKRHNEVVKSDQDVVIHAGDFAFVNKKIDVINKLIGRLNGTHIFIRGSHDKWMPQVGYHEIYKTKIENKIVVVSHYAMRRWGQSHYNSYHLFGHSHGNLEGFGKSFDIGVDTNNFYPYSWEQIKEIMNDRPDNENLIRS